jgi:hypothetical protein
MSEAKINAKYVQDTIEACEKSTGIQLPEYFKIIMGITAFALMQRGYMIGYMDASEGKKSQTDPDKLFQSLSVTSDLIIGKIKQCKKDMEEMKDGSDNM